MSIYSYNKYKIIIDPESKKTQGLHIGDVVRRQYFDRPNLIYSLMVVLDIGVDLINGKESYYFIGALLEGDEPENGQLLDFVRVTSLLDNDRSGALYLTASDSESPYMDVIDGLGKERSLVLAEKPQRTTSSFVIPLGSKVTNPERLLISYRIRASKETTAEVQVGYIDEIDGIDTINVSTEWEYKLTAITIDFPAQYERQLTITPALGTNNWCEVSDLNVVRLSDIATFAGATKARMGKVTGIIDPVFGMLEGYGAYFQNLYATRNVNIAGTLTAGDENGFASTFYVGKIHKNVILNSIESAFTNSAIVDMATPVGIGRVRRLSGNSTLTVQSSDWRTERIGRKYCFSIWVKSGIGNITLYQDEHLAGAILVETTDEWRRYKVPFTIQSSQATSTTIRFNSTIDNILVTAPQMEAGTNPSQYQPTDGKLSYVEDYGAWFNKGGIGGTIQNPLLKLNEDGSISSCDDSFVINRDGTGHFASGRFKWTKDTIELQDVTIRWEDLDEETKDNITAKLVSITGDTTFKITDLLNPTPQPEFVRLFGVDTGFLSTQQNRKWQFRRNEQWVDIVGANESMLEVRGDSQMWDNAHTLSIRYVVAFSEQELFAVATLNKIYDGDSIIQVVVSSTQGTTFKNGAISSTLSARVYRGSSDITDRIHESEFRWLRISSKPDEDNYWNNPPKIGKTIEITDKDISIRAAFECEVNLNISF